jgi:hypothetical protein
MHHHRCPDCFWWEVLGIHCAQGFSVCYIKVIDLLCWLFLHLSLLGNLIPNIFMWILEGFLFFSTKRQLRFFSFSGIYVRVSRHQLILDVNLIFMDP